MPLGTTSKHDLVAHLQSLGLSRDTDVVVHSRLISFGVIEGGPQTVYAALRDVLGPAATIAVPTYTVNNAGPQGDQRVFDPAETPSEAVGVLSEYVRGLPTAVRSASPTHSHAAVGPKAQILKRANTNSINSFGPGSDFDLFLREGFSTLYLGCSFKEAGTFTFHVEAMFGAIPYREWVELPRRVKRNGEIDRVSCRYYRRVSLNAHEDLTIVEDALRQQKKVVSSPCMFGASHLIRLTDFYGCVLGLLQSDPAALLAKH